MSMGIARNFTYIFSNRCDDDDILRLVGALGISIFMSACIADIGICIFPHLVLAHRCFFVSEIKIARLSPCFHTKK